VISPFQRYRKECPHIVGGFLILAFDFDFGFELSKESPLIVGGDFFYV
jgi:hypothetical protein